MTQFIVNKTNSYTLVASTETGNVALVIADDLREKLETMLSEADTSADAAAGILDILGKDAPAYLEAMGELAGMGGGASAAYAEGGIAGLQDMLAEHGPHNGALGDIAKAVEGGNGFAGFEGMDGHGVADILGYGATAQDDPFAEEGSAAGNAAIEKMLGSRNGGVMEGNETDLVEVGREEGREWIPVYTMIGVGGMLAVMATAAAKVVISNAIDGLQGAVDDTNTPNSVVGTEVTFIPADPNEDVPDVDLWTPWETSQDLGDFDGTYGQTIPDDPNGGPPGDLPATFDPDAELGELILTDPDDVQQAITAQEVADAAQAKIDQLILIENGGAEFEFADVMGVVNGLGGGQDFEVATSEDGLTANVQVGAVEPAEIALDASAAEQHFDANADTFAFM